MAYYQQNMLSIKSRTILANILAEVVLLSESIQSYREALANIDYFDCIALFRFLDREEKGYLREKDFERVIGTSHRKLLTYAFSWFDNMKVGQISRLQFAVFLLPKDNLQLRQLVAQRVQNPQISYSQHETILDQFQIFRRLLLQMMKRQMKIIELRRQLVKNDDYSSKGLLVAIDSNEHHWVCSQDLFKFLKNYGFDVNVRQVEKLMEIINYNLDGKISQQQLSWVVQGFQTKNKQYLNKIKSSNKKQEYIPHLSKRLHTQPLLQKQAANVQSDQNKTLSIEFNLLMQKMRLAELQQKQVDQQLVKFELKSIQQNKKLCQLKLQAVNHQKIVQQEAQRQKIIEQQLRQKQVSQILMREAQLLKESERLKILQNKLLYYTDNIPQVRPPYYESKRLYSFAEQSPKSMSFGKNFQIIDAHIPLPRKDYKDLTNLNSLSIIESYRKTSGRSELPYNNLQNNSDYLGPSTQIKEKIRRQRQIQKQIQDKFTKGEYNTSRFNSRVSQSKQQSNAKPKDQSSIHNGSVVINFQSPQRVPNFKKNNTNKMTISTGNKMSSEKV